jgi:hypothetical protein
MRRQSNARLLDRLRDDFALDAGRTAMREL